MEFFPLEIKEAIASSLSLEDILSICSINLSWNEICQSGHFWYLLTERDFPDHDKKPNISWREFYRDLANFAKLIPFFVLEIPKNKIVTGIYGKYKGMSTNNNSLIRGKPFSLGKTQTYINSEKDNYVCFYMAVYEGNYTLEDFYQTYNQWLKERERTRQTEGEDIFDTFYGIKPGYLILKKKEYTKRVVPSVLYIPPWEREIKHYNILPPKKFWKQGKINCL